MINVRTLFTVETAATFLRNALDLAQQLKIDTTSWREGDPTKTLLEFAARQLANREGVAADFIKAGFLSTATGDWLTVLAYEVYGVERDEATFALCEELVLTNTQGGQFVWEPGDLTVKSTATQKTYRNTTGGTLTAFGTLTLSVEADEAGTDSNAAEDEIDALVTTALGVVVSSSTAAEAIDEQSNDSLKEECRDTLGALSPNGPADAYEYVVLQEDLTGVTDITRSAASEDAVTGNVTVWVGSPSGGVSSASITAAQDAVEEWATPLCVTPTVSQPTLVGVSVVGTVSGDNIPADYETLITARLNAYFAGLPIAKDTVSVVISISKLKSEVQVLLEGLKVSNLSVVLSSPAADVSLSAGELATLTLVDFAEV